MRSFGSQLWGFLWPQWALGRSGALWCSGSMGLGAQAARPRQPGTAAGRAPRPTQRRLQRGSEKGPNGVGILKVKEAILNFIFLICPFFKYLLFALVFLGPSLDGLWSLACCCAWLPGPQGPWTQNTTEPQSGPKPMEARESPKAGSQSSAAILAQDCENSKKHKKQKTPKSSKPKKTKKT